MSIAHVLACLAGGECVLACVLALGLCTRWPFPKPPYSDRARKRSLADGWRFVLLLKVLALLALAAGMVANFLRERLAADQEQVWATIAAMLLASFAALEIYCAWSAWRAARTYGGRWRLSLCMFSFAFVMLLLGEASVYGFFDRQWPPVILPWDMAYVLPALWLVALLCGVLTRLIVSRVRLPRIVAGILWSVFFLGAAYAALVPLHGAYLAAMLSYESVIPTTYSAHFTRAQSLRGLVPYLSSSAFEGLNTHLWDEVTHGHERPDDPLYMEQLRAAAYKESAALQRLWVLDAEHARYIAHKIVVAQKYDFSCYGEEVLFLERPDLDVFKEFIPNDEKRRELSALFKRWSMNAPPRSVRDYVIELERPSVHKLSAGFREVRAALTEKCGRNKSWFCFQNESMPAELIPSAIDFLTFASRRNAYGMLSTPNPEHALRIVEALCKVDRRGGCGCGFNMRAFLFYAHPGTALACTRQVVQNYGEKAILDCWLRSQSQSLTDYPRCIEMGARILEHWDQVVPGAPRLSGGRAQKDIDAFLTARLAQP